ncbi:hypothetical protein mRhiFer1_008874 [Rhinolophus ferrumequinum]|uniref:Uncharacterized protein n=1 Tax=Rhinolophus ferrumequinum TaxID=59479 RepID=A0A7J8AG75_RHIFE|nr:hypothetical protein mRhiFer1_008874 [Rhinolophus ferrumequinum]
MWQSKKVTLWGQPGARIPTPLFPGPGMEDLPAPLPASASCTSRVSSVTQSWVPSCLPHWRAGPWLRPLPLRPQCLEQHQARGVVNPRLLSKQTKGFVRHADSAQNLRRKDAQHLEAQLFLLSAQQPKVTLPHDRACP